MVTQGTADLIFDLCDDFWDGEGVQTIDLQDRRQAKVNILS